MTRCCYEKRDAKDDEDWEDEANWYKVNPSLGYTVDIERLRDAYREAKQNPADEVTFKWLRCNMWVSATTAWIPYQIYMLGNEPIAMTAMAYFLSASLHTFP